ncbi:MAG TPA: hypothetical protein VJN94_10870 [Candidatus Binataceae bacterium]|nr:hypothetical protein [Candidatus Binataceae bacterium]
MVSFKAPDIHTPPHVPDVKFEHCPHYAACLTAPEMRQLIENIQKLQNG